MRINKIFYGIMIAILIAIFGYHFKLNYDYAIKPPSEKWAKEVLIGEGDFKGMPSISTYKEDYVVACSEGKNIKVILIDKLGKVVKDASFNANTEVPQDINIFTDKDNNILLSYFATGQDNGSIKIIKLDEELKQLEESSIDGPINYTKINNQILAGVYENKIDIINFEDKSIKTVETGENTTFASSVEYGDKQVVIYTNIVGDFNYFFIENGLPSEVKMAGTINQLTRVKFTNIMSIIDKDIVTTLIEYRYKSEYTGYKYISFSLETGELIKDGEFPLKNPSNPKGFSYNGEGAGIATPAPFYTKESAGFLISGDRDAAKGRNQTDILEMNIEDGMGVVKDPVSRTKSISINPDYHGDTLVFIDAVKDSHAKLYVTSTREDFKAVNNAIRLDEAFIALIETSEGLIFSIAYVFSYGMIWIIPGLCIVSLLSLIEYRFSYKVRKALFISGYIIAAAIKIFVVRSLSFNKLGFFLPSHFTFEIGVMAMVAISLVCLAYGYINYKKDLEKNVMALSFTAPILIDAALTLSLFVAFFK